jgi:bifunctional enzyme CysN/CysC
MSDIAATSRFVIVDEYEISGGGIVMQEMEDQTSWVRDKVLMRNYKWVGSEISSESRAEKYNQKAALVLITGEKSSPRKEIARSVERQLFDDGRFVYYLGIGGLMFGLDADIIDINMVPLNRKEHIRRLAEVAHIMLDAGMILIVSAVELNAADLDVIKTSIQPESISVIWVGNEPTTDIPVRMHLPEIENVEASAMAIRKLLNL